MRISAPLSPSASSRSALSRSALSRSVLSRSAPVRRAAARPAPSRRLLLLGALALPALAACGGADEPAPSEATGTASTGAIAADPDALSLEDAWAVAAESDMTAVFGTLVNAGDLPVRLIGASTPAAARAELHETVDAGGGMSMRPKEGGFPIAPGASLVLEPGGDHIMLLDLAAPLEAGTSIEVELALEGVGTLAVTVPVRDFAGAQEEYVGASDGGR